MPRPPIDRLSFDDAQILRLESPSITGHTMKLIVLGGDPLGVEELRALVSPRLGTQPRARQRVAFTPLRLGAPAWVDDPDFEVRLQVQDRGNGPLDEEGLRQVAGEIMSSRLRHDRPLWAFDLVGPLQGGGTALVARIHHAMADGIACTRFLEEVLWDPPRPREAAADAEQPWHPEPPSTGDLVLDALASHARSLAGGAAGAVRAAGSAEAWRRSARELAALPATLRRELAPDADETPLDRPIGIERRLAFTAAPLEDLAAVGHSQSGHVTVNDVLLAAVAGGLRSWMGGGGAGAHLLRAQIPVSLHSRDEEAGALGNRDSFLNVGLPLDESDPIARLRRINNETSVRKEAGDARELYDLFHALSRVRPLYRAANRLAGGAREFTLSISNVPGPRQPVTVGGRPVKRLVSFAEPASRHALRVSALSCAGSVEVGLCADPAAAPRLEDLAEAIDVSIAQLRDAAGV